MIHEWFRCTLLSNKLKYAQNGYVCVYGYLWVKTGGTTVKRLSLLGVVAVHLLGFMYESSGLAHTIFWVPHL